jgi:hypothetical protein
MKSGSCRENTVGRCALTDALQLWTLHPISTMPELNHDRILEEAASLEQLRKGGVLKTVGKVLLWVELVPLVFLYTSWRAGSDLLIWWAVIEGVLGLTLYVVGARKRADALLRLGVVSPAGPAPELEFDTEQKRRTS